MLINKGGKRPLGGKRS